MMENPKISVIIPIYNTKEYLVKCLESVINQTYSELEIILVDDGSTDGSRNIIEKYAQKDQRIIPVYKENGGEASARNAGMEVATGVYVAFVDSDDWIELDMYQELVDALENGQIDIVSCGYFFDRDGILDEANNLKPVTEGVFDRTKLLEYVFMRDSYKGLAAYSWNKIFRREMLIDESGYLRYEVKYKIGTDVLWFANVALRCATSKYVSRPLYHYVQRGSSAVHSQDLHKQMQRIEVYQRVVELFEKEEIESNIIIYVKRFLAYHAMNIAKMAKEQKNSEIYEETRWWMNRYKNEYKFTNYEWPERIKEFEELLGGEIIV